MSRTQLALFIALLFVIGVVGVVAATVRHAMVEAWPRIEEASQLPPFPAHEEPRLVAELEYLQQRGLFAARGDQRDAAPVLNRLVDASDPIEGLTPAWWARKEGWPSALFEPGPVEAWLDDPALTRDYDLSFLADWRAFDHWDWAAEEPFAGHLRGHPQLCAQLHPIPYVVSFQALARARMAQGYWNGELEVAAWDTEQLALLAASTDTLVGQMVGLAILGIEASVVQRAIVDDRLNGALVPTWGRDELARAQDALFAVGGLYALDPTTPFAAELAARADALPGVCAGLGEGSLFWSSMRPVIEDPYDCEEDRSHYIAAMQALLDGSSCEITAYRALWEHGAGPWTCDFGSEGGEERVLHLLRVPCLRSAGFTAYRPIGTPNFVAHFLDEDRARRAP
jgi:hypothetical protein